MRDFLAEEIRRRDYVVGVIRQVYDRYGFDPLETPALENIQNLLGRYGDEGNKLIYKILKRGEHESSGEPDLALRYDLTVPLARVVAEHQGKLPRIFKRYQIQPVWRAERPGRGRFREFYQCDIDIVGSKSALAEVELISAASEALTQLGFREFRIGLNHRQLLPEFLNANNVPQMMHSHALVAIDKLDKQGPDAVAKEMVGKGIEEAIASGLLEALSKAMTPGPTFHDTARLAWEGLHRTFEDSQARQEVDEILSLCEHTPAAGKVIFDPSLVRGLSYYTGAIMEVAVPDLGGSLGGGGRYDNLIGTFLGTEIPACGFSLGLERILVVMQERDMFATGLPLSEIEFLVVQMDGQAQQAALTLAARLRALGDLRIDLYPEVVEKFGDLYRYLDHRTVKWIIGVRGKDGDVVNRRDVRNRKNDVLTIDALFASMGNQDFEIVEPGKRMITLDE